MMESSVSHCPVPTEQQPVNEYEELKSAWLFRDCAASWRDYMTKIAWIFGITGVFAVPVAAASFPPHKHLVEFLISSAAGASIGVVLILTRLYLGWIYVRDRLTSPVVFYEESGWYDGQTWQKPQEVVTRDRLIVSYQLQPILRRLQLTFLGLGTLYVAGCIIWQIL
jgi:Conserved in the green lineage and diatoms 27